MIANTSLAMEENCSPPFQILTALRPWIHVRVEYNSAPVASMRRARLLDPMLVQHFRKHPPKRSRRRLHIYQG